MMSSSTYSPYERETLAEYNELSCLESLLTSEYFQLKFNTNTQTKLCEYITILLSVPQVCHSQCKQLKSYNIPRPQIISLV